MGGAKEFSDARGKAVRWLPSLAAAAGESLGAARLETLAILTDVDQVSTLFSSLDDLRLGKIVNMSDAFGDL